MENTIFFGNGINLLSPKNKSWKALLDEIKESRTFDHSTLPNTMIYERILMERPIKTHEVLKEEYSVKSNIASLMSTIEPNEIYSFLYLMNFQHYLTTNYDNAFIDSILNLKEINLPIIEYSTEDVYSLRRRKRISNQKEQEKNFWQIHGEIRKPATIMLGLDHYCGSVAKINDYIKGGYNYEISKEKIIEDSIEKKFEKNSFTKTSWVEFFYTTNVHIIGFSLDYSEIDLWWVLNKRARAMKGSVLNKFVKNKVIFYCTEIDEQKKGLLESLNVIVKVQELPKTKTKYYDYYQNLVDKLRKEI